MKVVIMGAGGRLGAALMRAYREEHEVSGFTHAQIDLGDFDEVEQLLARAEFDVMINCAAMTNVDLCEEQGEEAFRINASAPELLAQICGEKSARFIHFSTDYVFDGGKTDPYTEEDPAEPLSVYGESKREGEENVLNVDERNLVVRVSWVFGPDRPSFVDQVIRRAREEEKVAAVADKFSAPTYTHDLAAALPSFFPADVGGILHFANAGECSWQGYAQYALDCCREAGLPLKATTVAPLKLSEMDRFVAKRPPYTVLSTARFRDVTGHSPRPWQEAVAEYVKNSYSQL